MSERRTRGPRKVPLWFDRINRYRLAAGFLFVPFVLTLIAWMTGVSVDTVLPMVARRSVYWVGLLFLTVALAMDAWEVYAGKRQVKRLMAAHLNRDEH